ncbi:hypothetical protein [Tardiphaga sp. 813_E8_N1_3]|uniref:hypothetical protein n=1 Tax=Tardiphaga sp. 813_E8_N1_3 TaxID=3240760 RepID=UPI003F2274EA
MKPFVEQARQILLRDIDPDFLESFAVDLAWEYSALYDRLADDAALDDFYRDEEFSRQRGDCAVRSLARAAKQHGVPYEFHRLNCNGQRKILVKAGRVVLILEPISTLADHPSTADYKVQLADTHGFVRQLELELGDLPNRIKDWSGTILGVLLHGPSGRRFDREQKSLGAVMLAVPDAAYSKWVLRLDLQTVAMNGRNLPVEDDIQSEPEQDDNVVVTSKKRNSEADYG